MKTTYDKVKLQLSEGMMLNDPMEVAFLNVFKLLQGYGFKVIKDTHATALVGQLTDGSTAQFMFMHRTKEAGQFVSNWQFSNVELRTKSGSRGDTTHYKSGDALNHWFDINLNGVKPIDLINAWNKVPQKLRDDNAKEMIQAVQFYSKKIPGFKGPK